MGRILLVGLGARAADHLTAAESPVAVETLQSLADGPALDATLTASELDVDAVVLGPAAGAPVALAQRVHARWPELPVLIVAASPDLPRLRQEVQFAPLLRSKVECRAADDPLGLAVTLADKVTRVRQRRRHRATVAALDSGLTGWGGGQAQTSDTLQWLLAHAPVGVLALDDEGRVRSCNEHAARILGATREQLRGQPLADRVVAADRAALQAFVRRAIAPGAAPTRRIFALDSALESAHESARERGAGPPRFMEATVGALAEQTGSMDTLVVLQDVSELQRAEAELLRHRDHLEELVAARTEDLERSNRDLRAFAYAASHDLQTPIRAVSGYCDMLQRRYAGRLDDDADEFLRFAVAGAKRMQALVNDLLAYTQVESQARERRPCDAEQILSEAIDLLAEPIQASGARITHDRLPRVTADARQLRELLRSLLDNGLKFCGDAPPRLHVAAERDGPCWKFSVRDDGIGIDPRYVDQVFGIFQRLHPDDVFPGTGMGLAVAKRIVERHGGRIWCESRPGEGATFYFTLSAEAGDDLPAEEAGPALPVDS